MFGKKVTPYTSYNRNDKSKRISIKFHTLTLQEIVKKCDLDSFRFDIYIV